MGGFHLSKIPKITFHLVSLYYIYISFEQTLYGHLLVIIHHLGEFLYYIIWVKYIVNMKITL